MSPGLWHFLPAHYFASSLLTYFTGIQWNLIFATFLDEVMGCWAVLPCDFRVMPGDCHALGIRPWFVTLLLCSRRYFVFIMPITTNHVRQRLVHLTSQQQSLLSPPSQHRSPSPSSPESSSSAPTPPPASLSLPQPIYQTHPP